MLSLHTNNAALSAQNSITRTQTSLSTSMTRLSTGYRINSAADDAAGLQIASRLKAQTSGMTVAMRNTQNASSMLQTADGALDEVGNMLVRMKDLATQADQADPTKTRFYAQVLRAKVSSILKPERLTVTAVGGTSYEIDQVPLFQLNGSSSLRPRFCCRMR